MPAGIHSVGRLSVSDGVPLDARNNAQRGRVHPSDTCGCTSIERANAPEIHKSLSGMGTPVGWTRWVTETYAPAGGYAGDAAGSCTVTQRPPAARGARVRVPSWALAMLLTIASPSPTPAWSVRMRVEPR